MAQETITLRLVAQDLMSGNVSKAIGSLDKMARRGGLVGSVMQGVGQSFGQLLNPVALVANGIGMVTDALGDSLDAYRQDQLSQAQLRTALEANIKAWDGNTDAIEGTIAARMKLGFSDDEQRASLALLVAQIGNVNDALAVQRTAMDLARLKGVSLSESATLLAKAYNGSATGLQRMGIKIESGSKGMAALGQVQKRVAGQAEAWGKTSAGAAAAFDVKVGELQESVGRLLDGPARGFLDFLSGVVDVIDGPSGASQNIRDLSHEILMLRTQTDALAQASPFEKLTADLQAWNDTLQLQIIGNGQTLAEQWVVALGPDTLRLFGKASAETLADVKALATGVIEAGGDFGEFAAIVRRKVAPEFNVLTSTWGTAMQSIEEQTAQTARNIPGIAWNIPMGIVDKLRDGIPDVRSVMKDLRWAIEHPLALTKNRTRIIAALTGDAMVKGINSKNPAIRQAAIDARAELLTAWNALPGKAMELGRLTIAELVRGLNEGEQYALGLYGQTGTDTQPGGGRGGNRHHNRHRNRDNSREAPANVTVVHIGALNEREGEALARTVSDHLERHERRRGRR